MQSSPEPIGAVLSRVVGELGGVLHDPRADETGIGAVVDADLASRTEVVYRDGELRIYAGSTADATLLKFERTKLAQWARESLGLGADPHVTVLVGRPGKRG